MLQDREEPLYAIKLGTIGQVEDDLHPLLLIEVHHVMRLVHTQVVHVQDELSILVLLEKLSDELLELSGVNRSWKELSMFKSLFFRDGT